MYELPPVIWWGYYIPNTKVFPPRLIVKKLLKFHKKHSSTEFLHTAVSPHFMVYIMPYLLCFI